MSSGGLLVALVEALRRENRALHEEVKGVCELVAEMHAAAVGEVRAPRLGVVEDVAEVRAELLRLRALRVSGAPDTDVRAPDTDVRAPDGEDVPPRETGSDVR